MSYLGMALRELSIRGDFRTTVEYLTHLIETEQFRTSHFTTGWLDQLIAERYAPKEPTPESVPFQLHSHCRSHMGELKNLEKKMLSKKNEGVKSSKKLWKIQK